MNILKKMGWGFLVVLLCWGALNVVAQAATSEAAVVGSSVVGVTTPMPVNHAPPPPPVKANKVAQPDQPSTVIKTSVRSSQPNTSVRTAARPSYPPTPDVKTTPGSQRLFIFDPKQFRWFAYENGDLINSGVASGGASYCPDIKRSCRTPSGSFKVVSKGGSGCRSSRYPLPNGGARMGYCVFFSKYYAVHASDDVPSNRNASHGCVRVRPDAARWLNQEFLQYGTRVVIKPY